MLSLTTHHVLKENILEVLCIVEGKREGEGERERERERENEVTIVHSLILGHEVTVNFFNNLYTN